MKKGYVILALAACVVLSGCSKSKEEETTAAATTAAPTTAAPTTAAPETEAEKILSVDEVIQSAAAKFSTDGDIAYHQVIDIDTSISMNTDSSSAVAENSGLVSEVTDETGESEEGVEESETTIEETTTAAEETESAVGGESEGESESETNGLDALSEMASDLNDIGAPIWIKVDEEYSKIGNVGHSKTTTDMFALLIPMQENAEMYTVQEGNKLTTYKHVLDNTVPDEVCWSVYESDMSEVESSLAEGYFVSLQRLIGKAKMTEDKVTGTYNVTGTVKYADIDEEDDIFYSTLSDVDVTVNYLIDSDDFSVRKYSLTIPVGDYPADPNKLTINAWSVDVDFTWPPVGESEVPADFVSNAEKYDGRYISNIDGVDTVLDENDNVLHAVGEPESETAEGESVEGESASEESEPESVEAESTESDSTEASEGETESSSSSGNGFVTSH